MKARRQSPPAATKDSEASGTKLLVCVSDIHAGSVVGLLPPNFVGSEGQDIPQTPFQQWLWKCWTLGYDWVQEVCGEDDYALLLNGDLTEGVHHGGSQIISKDGSDHVRAAQESLEPLAMAAKKVFVVKGTECHTGSYELTLGMILGSETDPDSHGRKPLHAFDRLTVEMGGVRCAFAHHIGTSIRSYLEATQFSVALNEEMTEAHRNGEAHPRVIVRSHRHRFGFFGNGHSLAFVTPPWQGLTRHGHKVVTGARCHPGILILDWRRVKSGELPEFHYRLFDAPHATVLKV